MNHKLNEAMDHVSDAFIADAAAQVNKARGAVIPMKPRPWLGAVAAVLVIVLIGALMFPVLNALDTSGGSKPPILQAPTTIVPTISPDAPTTVPSDVPTTAPTSGSTTTVPTTRPTTRPTTIPTSDGVGDPCGKGHSYLNGFCVYCAAQDPNYNPCANGHEFHNGYCVWCLAADPSYASTQPTTAPPITNPTTTTTPSLSVTLKTDKTHYTTAELVRFTISSADTNNTLCIYGVDSTYSRFIHQAGTFYMVPFPSAGKYKAQVIARTETSEVTSAEVYFTVTDAGDIVAPTYAQVRTNKTTYKPGEAVTFTLSSDGSVNMLQIYYLPTGNAEYYQDVGTTFTYTPSQSGAYHAEVITFNGATSFRSHRISFSVSYPCDEGHTYQDGRCIYCSSSDPNYDRCANGHTFKNGWCVNCHAPDTVSFAIIAADAFKYKQGGTVTLHMYCSGTINNLVIFKPNGITETIQNVGSDYTYTPTIVGQYQAHVITLNGDSRFESEKLTFRVVETNSAILPSNQQHPCANGHFLEDGICTKCGSLVYVVYPCSDGHSYENGSCTKCGMVACTTNHTLVQGKHRCTQCNTHIFCLNGVHRVENGVCTLCGKSKPAACTDGHIYCDYVCVRCWSRDPATCRQNSHNFYNENGLDYQYCTRCGVSTRCAYDIEHAYENGVCKDCGNLEDRDQDCKLIVNGKDITAGNYVKINIRNSNASVPLTAVLTELGIPWEWESETVLRFGSGDYEQTLDTSYNIQFNWLAPFRTPGVVRKVVDGEVIVDIQSLWVNLLNKMGISCEMDCAAKTIRIDTPA